MFEHLLESFVYYGACAIGIFMLISFISITLGGSFAGELFAIVSGIVLLALLDFSLSEIVCSCLIINILLFLWRRFRGLRRYAGEWRDESGRYLLNIKVTNEEVFVETNLFNDFGVDDFDVELSKHSIKLISSIESCIIKKGFSNKLELTLGSRTLILYKEACHRGATSAQTIVTAKQQALLGLSLGVCFAAIQTIMQVEGNYYLFLESLTDNMIMYAIYGFGYIFSLSFFVILSEIMYNSIDAVVSASPSVSMLTIFIAITIIFIVFGMAFIPGIFIGIKAILDEI